MSHNMCHIIRVMSSYLSAVFELHPSRRKAAIMERARLGAERVFWDVIGSIRGQADAVAAVSDTKERRVAARQLHTQIASAVHGAVVKALLPEPVEAGLVRDVQMSAMSYVELRAGGAQAEWPYQRVIQETDRIAALDQFQSAFDRDAENSARDELARVSKEPASRPLTIARSRDGRLVRKSSTGQICAVLNLITASDRRARKTRIAAGIDASTGDALAAMNTATRIVVPLSCSKWHEHKFLSGRATLRSSLIIRRGDRWFMCAQFEMVGLSQPSQTGAVIGVDRGIINPIATAVIATDGSVRMARDPQGAAIGAAISRAEARRKQEQKRRGHTRHRHVRFVDHTLHHLANQIVADARAFGARVVTEKLDAFKTIVTTKRPKGSRKAGWRKSLKRAQLGKLETILAYKLKFAGLPPLRDVVPGGTSITCPACSHRDPKSRIRQDLFTCTSCGFTAHADTIGGVNIGRRGIAMLKVTKGAKLAPIEQDIVARLRSRDDRGLGPLLATGFPAGNGLVAALATADTAYDPSGLTVSAGQKIPYTGQNASNRVFAERVEPSLGTPKPGNKPRRQRVTRGRLESPYV